MMVDPENSPTSKNPGRAPQQSTIGTLQADSTKSLDSSSSKSATHNLSHAQKKKVRIQKHENKKNASDVRKKEVTDESVLEHNNHSPQATAPQSQQPPSRTKKLNPGLRHSSKPTVVDPEQAAHDAKVMRDSKRTPRKIRPFFGVC